MAIGYRLRTSDDRDRDRLFLAGAFDVLGRITVPRENRRLRLRHGILLVDALLKKGQREGAIAAPQTLRAEFPKIPEVRQRLPAAGM